MIAIITIIANIFVHWIIQPLKIRLMRKFPKTPARWKPLDCEGCMSVWITAAWYLRCDYIWQAVLLMGASYLLAGLVSKIFVLYLNKYYARIFR